MRVSFIHRYGPQFASFRYRAAMPAKAVGASLNDVTADICVWCKPTDADFRNFNTEKVNITDFCDDHFNGAQFANVYATFRDSSDACSTPTQEMARRITASTPSRHPPVQVIAEPYEMPEMAPHCHDGALIWFGHAVNQASLRNLSEQLENLAMLRIVSNLPGAIPWSVPALEQELAYADIFVLPRTAPYKSANRAVEALRMGCFVVAEPHPSLVELRSFIWTGDIPEGLAWVKENRSEVNDRIAAAQRFIRSRFSPEVIGAQWQSLIARTVQARINQGDALCQ